MLTWIGALYAALLLFLVACSGLVALFASGHRRRADALRLFNAAGVLFVSSVLGNELWNVLNR
ncbi:hypothetical protein H4696_008816 [Amycolatopsis lexingtonensis]|uniref:Uncharacterized protein n=1 Tax=Amycolatopsis lexingtonensis TaxID=218822 RepID=A0ABR9IEW0_9PSEU|nr:hypothetical protein [Amycolatopsis lexingtonensis]MBE1501716.1 hypothetical protein [Amycolatopsis lexingtonensis]